MNRKSIIAGVAALVILIALGVSYGGTKEVSWTPPVLAATAVNGVSTTTSVSFVPDKNLNLVSVALSDNLRQYATVTPASIGKVSKGQRVTIALSLSAPENTPPQVLTGELTLFKDNGAAKAQSVLPVTLSLEPVPLPPDPGEAGKQTLEGVDSDGDGLRDDIQRYIALKYWDEPEVAAGLRQYARPLQQEILHFDNEAAALADTQAEDVAFACVEYRTGSLEEADRITDELIIEMLDTEARGKAYFRYNQQLGGHVFPGRPLPKPELCTEPVQ